MTLTKQYNPLYYNYKKATNCIICFSTISTFTYCSLKDDFRMKIILAKIVEVK